MANLTVFNYNGANICFAPDNETVYINATQMAKPFSKLPKDYLKTQPAKEFIAALESQKDYIPFESVKVTKGGNNSGTWMHEDVALDFAQWLSPHFKVWCIQRLKELMKTGKVETQPKTDLDKIREGYELLIQRVEQLESEKQQLIEAQPQKVERTGIDVIEYTEKSIAVFGNTKPLKDGLKELGGAFNKRLKFEGKVQCGWIFPRFMADEVIQFLRDNTQ